MQRLLFIFSLFLASSAFAQTTASGVKLTSPGVKLTSPDVALTSPGVTLTSPDGRLKVNLDISDGQLCYTVWDDDFATASNVYALANKVALNVDGLPNTGYKTITKPTLVKEDFTAPNYKLTRFSDSYNTVTVKARNGIDVELRAYNSGVAYRFVAALPKKEWKVTDELAEFNFPADNMAYLPYSTNPKKPKAMAFQATYDVAPLSQTKALDAFLPATVSCGKAKVTILETDVQDYPGMFLLPGAKDGKVASSPNDGEGAITSKGSEAANGNSVYGLRADFAHYPTAFDYYPWRQQKYVTQTAAYIAQGKGAKTFPWRILAISRNDKEMPLNTLAYQLAEPSRLKDDTDWIKPGKVAWDWWNDWNITGVDFVSGINQQTYYHYIDFAAEQGLEYIILDEGWYNPKSGDMLTVIPELNLQQLVDYGQRRGVGIILWTVFNVLDRQLDEACQTYSKMGIKGFKVDFLDRYDQEAVEMIYRIADRCAKHHLVLDYHGIFAPQGIQRTYPNVLNFEAVFGMEEVKWTEREKGVDADGKRFDRPSKDMPLYDVTFPFIRGMAGPVDFTPGGMRNATKADFQPVNSNPMTMGTRCHQMAHYIVHESALTMLADNPTAYRQEAECTAFLSSLPTVYDEMRVVAGKMGEYIVVARRKGNDWYVAGETNWDARDITIDPAFLPSGTYHITAFIDGPNADRNATDYQRFEHTFPLSPAYMQPITLHLASGGGFVAKLICE